jgi:hypothetical protein
MPQSANPFVNWTISDLWPWLQPPVGIFSQPILPGWTPTLNINSNNSTAPQTEMAVVEKHSYGRQLGRISDALRVPRMLSTTNSSVMNTPGACREATCTGWSRLGHPGSGLFANCESFVGANEP